MASLLPLLDNSNDGDQWESDWVSSNAEEAEDDKDNDDEDENAQEIDYPDEPEEEHKEEEEDNDDEPEEEDDQEAEPDPPDEPLRTVVSRTAQCAVCCNDVEQLVDAALQVPICFNTLQAYDLTKFRKPQSDCLSRSCAVIAPCGNPEHLYCVGCIHRFATDNVEPVLRVTHGFLPCLSFEPTRIVCSDFRGRQCVFEPELLEHVLTVTETNEFQTAANRFRRQRSSTDDAVAMDNLNHYAWSPGKSVMPYFPALCTQTQLNVETLRQQIAYIRESDQPDVMCKECGVILRKTSCCNCLSHCGVEICNICGYSDVTIPCNHWLECPRYEHERQWRVETGWMCEEGKCFFHGRECKDVTHQKGRKNSDNLRRAIQLERLLASLPPSLRDVLAPETMTSPKK